MRANIQDMWAYFTLLPLSGLFLLLSWSALPVNGIEVTSGSSCTGICGGRLTFSTDIVCTDSAYNGTSQGQKMRDCLTCEAASNAYSSPTDNDLYWFLFNMKYTVESCLFPESSTSPALTACESTCSPLDVVLTYSWFTNGQASAGQYDYCAQNGSVFVQYAGGCANCLKTQKDSVILGNFLDTMDSACSTQPNATHDDTIPVASLFASATAASSTATSTSTSTTTTATSTSSPAVGGSPSLSTGAKAGIGVGVAIGALMILAALIFFLYRRRNRPSGRNESDGDVRPAPGAGSELGTDSARTELAGFHQPPVYEMNTDEERKAQMQLHSHQQFPVELAGSGDR